jgi:hypothetical protein
MLYASKWDNREKNATDRRAALQISRFATIWREFKAKSYAHDGLMYSIKIKPPK